MSLSFNTSEEYQGIRDKGQVENGRKRRAKSNEPIIKIKCMWVDHK